MKYRAEIDGLRALAVLPVILFHAGFEWFSGGGESIEYIEATSKLYLKVEEAINNMVSTDVILDRDM